MLSLLRILVKLLEKVFRGVADCLLAQVQMSPGVSALSPDGIVHDYIEGAALSESDLCTNLDLGFTVATVYVY